VKSVRNGKAIGWKSTVEGQDIVPDVKGMTFRDAIFLLEKAGLRVFYEGKGKVQNQSIQPGGRVRKGDAIYVKLG
jgi:cell division protein FtsI (penicillin-binding protein 3)